MLSQTIYLPAPSLDDSGVPKTRIDVMLANLEKDGEFFATNVIFENPEYRIRPVRGVGIHGYPIRFGDATVELMQPELRDGDKGHYRLYFRTPQEAEFLERFADGHGISLTLDVES